MNCEDYAELYIEDADGKIDLLDNHGIRVTKWLPRAPQAKDGGLYGSSPFNDGKTLIQKKDDNITDTFTLNVTGQVPDDVIERLQNLRRKLNRAVEYWTTEYQNNPVWIGARGRGETNKRYAIIINHDLPEENDPYTGPMIQDLRRSAEVDLVLTLEHGYWQAQEIGTEDCLPLTDQELLPLLYAAEFDALTSSINLGSVAVIDNLHAADFWAEAWVKPDTWGENQQGRIFDKTESGLTGWFFALDDVHGLVAGSYHAGGDALSEASGIATMRDGNWHHVGAQFHIADLKWHLFYDGVEQAYVTQTAGIGAVDSDAANNLFIGNRSPGWDRTFDGLIGWCRIKTGSVHAANFVPDPRCYLPAKDATTIGIWIYGPTSTYLNATGAADPHGHASNVTPQVACYKTVGEVDTCYGVPVASFYNRFQITHVFWWDAAPGVWSDNLQTRPHPVNLGPAVPAAGDYLYIGSCDDYSTSADTQHGPFHNIIIKHAGVAGVFANIELSNGAGGWVAIATDYAADIGGNRQLITFNPTNVWGQQAVNGFTGWWVRIDIGGVFGLVSSVQPLYCANRPYVNLAAEDILGDVNALLSAEIYNHFDSALFGPMAGCFLSVTSDDRNPNFVGAIPAGGYYNLPHYIYNPGFLVLGALTPNPAAPDGAYWLITFAGPVTNCAGSVDLHDFYGRVRVFPYLVQTGGAFADASITERIICGMWGNTSPDAPIPLTLPNFLDLRQLLMTTPQMSTTPIKVNSLNMTVYNRVAGAKTVAYYGHVLVPSEEWVGYFFSDDPVNAAVDRLAALRVGTEIPKINPYCNVWTPTYPKTDGALLQVSCVTPPQVQHNKDQRLHIVPIGNTNNPYPRWTGLVKLYKTERYLSARGSR